MDYPIQTPGQLAAHLRAFRQAKGLTQATLGQALGVGQARVARIEGNPTSISVDQFLQLLSALGLQMVLSPMNSAESKAREPAPPPYRSTPSGEGDW